MGKWLTFGPIFSPYTTCIKNWAPHIDELKALEGVRWLHMSIYTLVCTCGSLVDVYTFNWSARLRGFRYL